MGMKKFEMGVQLYETQRRFNRACEFASQHQATWSKETLPVCKIQRLQDFTIPSTIAHYDRRRVGQAVLPLRRHEEK